MRVAFWSEFVHPHTVAHEIGEILATQRIDVIVAINEIALNDNKFMQGLKEFENLGIKYGLWPLLRDADGYWLNALNVQEFKELVDKILQWICQGDLNPYLLAFDLEPPIYLIKHPSISMFLRYIRKSIKLHKSSAEVLANCAEHVKNQGISPVCVVFDVIFEFDKPELISRLMGLPMYGIPWDEINLMTYNTLVSKWYRISIEACRYRMLRILQRAKYLAPTSNISVSLGLTSVGKMGNEPFYLDPRDLSMDISVAVSCGVNAIYVYSLDGILAKNKHERKRWIESIRKLEKPLITVSTRYKITSLLMNLMLSVIKSIVAIS